MIRQPAEHLLVYLASSIEDVLESKTQVAEDYAQMHPFAGRADIFSKMYSRLTGKPYVPPSTAVVYLPRVWHFPDQDEPATGIDALMQALPWGDKKLTITDNISAMNVHLPSLYTMKSLKLLRSNVTPALKSQSWGSDVFLYLMHSTARDVVYLIKLTNRSAT